MTIAEVKNEPIPECFTTVDISNFLQTLDMVPIGRDKSDYRNAFDLFSRFGTWMAKQKEGDND